MRNRMLYLLFCGPGGCTIELAFPPLFVFWCCPFFLLTHVSCRAFAVLCRSLFLHVFFGRVLLSDGSSCGLPLLAFPPPDASRGLPILAFPPPDASSF